MLSWDTAITSLAICFFLSRQRFFLPVWAEANKGSENEFSVDPTATEPKLWVKDLVAAATFIEELESDTTKPLEIFPPQGGKGQIMQIPFSKTNAKEVKNVTNQSPF